MRQDADELTEGEPHPVPDSRSRAPETRNNEEVPSLSVVIPAFNEAVNLPEVITELIQKLELTDMAFEVLVVDDGSTDDTNAVMRTLTNQYRQCRSIRLRRNTGKANALAIGFRLSRGEFIAMMDGDGQDDPGEIPRMLELLGEDCQLVTGQRIIRQDRLVKRRTSRVYNAVTRWLTGVQGSDFNSGLKVMTKDLTDSIDLYGELHRYLPILAAWDGFSVAEIDVNHRSRLHGSSKYGLARFWRGLFDLVVVKFLTSYNRRPFHLFGGIGILSAIIGIGLLMWMLVLHFMDEGVGTRPAFLTGVLFCVVAVQLFSFGLLAELLVNLRRRHDPRWEENR